ncbi:MAG: FxLYD domain-containing protein, partial [Rhodothermales bacterium]|nr:FxLYD domain-containing protein [Rhodothermales bacterium]
YLEHPKNGLIIDSCCAPKRAPQLHVEKIDLKQQESGARILTGTVLNDSKQAVRGAQVQITLFDAKNRRVDGMFAVVRDIPAHGSVDFREPVQSDYDVRGARVRSVLIINR